MPPFEGLLFGHQPHKPITVIKVGGLFSDKDAIKTILDSMPISLRYYLYERSYGPIGEKANPPQVLRQVLESRRDKRVWLTIFARADDMILDVFRDYKDRTVCEKILFSIGCEALSQYALDKLNKGTKAENTIKLAQLILERGGTVVLGMMDHYVFANRQMVNETLDSLKMLKDVAWKFPRHRIKFTNNGVTHWPSKEAVSEFTDAFTSVEEGGYKRYIANIPKKSDVFHCNKIISMALVDSGIEHRGAGYFSLK